MPHLGIKNWVGWFGKNVDPPKTVNPHVDPPGKPPEIGQNRNANDVGEASSSERSVASHDSEVPELVELVGPYSHDLQTQHNSPYYDDSTISTNSSWFSKGSSKGQSSHNDKLENAASKQSTSPDSTNVKYFGMSKARLKNYNISFWGPFQGLFF